MTRSKLWDRLKTPSHFRETLEVKKTVSEQSDFAACRTRLTGRFIEDLATINIVSQVTFI